MLGVPRKTRFWLPTWLVIIVVFITFFLNSSIAGSQFPTPTPITPNPTVIALQATIQTQQLKIDNLAQDLELTHRELNIVRAEIKNDLDTQLMPAKILLIIVVVIGLSSVVSVFAKLKKIEAFLVMKMKDSLEKKALKLQESLSLNIEKSLTEKIQVQIAKHIQYIDPTNVPVHIPYSNFKNELQRLKRFGFRNFQTYKKLDDTCLEGCIIINLSKDPSIDNSETDDFIQFVKKHKLDPDKVGFMFYITNEGQFNRELFKIHPVIDYSSSITTLSGNVLVIARSLLRFSGHHPTTE